MAKVKSQTVRYVKLSDVVGKHAHLCEVLSESAPFTWGDNDHSLVSARRVLAHLKSMTDSITNPADEGVGEVSLCLLRGNCLEIFGCGGWDEIEGVGEVSLCLLGLGDTMVDLEN